MPEPGSVGNSGKPLDAAAEAEWHQYRTARAYTTAPFDRNDTLISFTTTVMGRVDIAFAAVADLLSHVNKTY